MDCEMNNFKEPCLPSLISDHFRAHSEKELQSLSKKYVAKDEEYNMASEGLEKELSALKHKYSLVSKEKLKLTKDKENLLEEVWVVLIE